jgi:hypothetical protein
MNKSLEDCKRECRKMHARYKTTDDTEEIVLTNKEAKTLLQVIAFHKRGLLRLDPVTYSALLDFQDRYQQRERLLKKCR